MNNLSQRVVVVRQWQVPATDFLSHFLCIDIALRYMAVILTWICRYRVLYTAHLHSSNTLLINQTLPSCRWLYFVQRTILNADVKLSMFREQLSQLCNQMDFLSQVKQAPDIYFSLVRECVRRHTFSHKFSQVSRA